jgi:hypothetical protein
MVFVTGGMKMTKITDNFCGYLNVGDDTFAYNVTNHVVTLLPAQIEQANRYKVLDSTL